MAVSRGFAIARVKAEQGEALCQNGGGRGAPSGQRNSLTRAEDGGRMTDKRAKRALSTVDCQLSTASVASPSIAYRKSNPAQVELIRPRLIGNKAPSY